MTVPIPWRRPLVAIAGGAIIALLTRAFIGSGQADLLARDLAGATGFPVATTTDLGHPWALALLAMGAAWTIWLCLEVRALWQQFALFAAALGLCLTGSWLAQVGGSQFPTVPVMAALCLAFIAGQIAAGFGGSPRQQALLALLEGRISPPRARALATGPEPAPDDSRDCLVTAIEIPDADKDFFTTLRQGLLSEGAFMHPRGDGLWLAVQGLWDDLDEAAAWSTLARAADSLVARTGVWKLATARARVRRLLDLGDSPSLHLRGRVTGELAILIEESQAAGDGLPLWLAASAPPEGALQGWQGGEDEKPPLRLKPSN